MPRLELTVLRPQKAAVTLQIDDALITMGRSSSCTVPIEDRFLSRRHAEIVAEGGGWVLRDNGSVNGTFLNGTKIHAPMPLGPGDRIRLGDAEVVVGGAGVDVAAKDVAPVTEFFLREADVTESADRSRIVHRLALELIADRGLSELFDFILDRVVDLMHPSRAALALLKEDQSVEVVNMRPANRDPRELAISRTLLREVIRDRKVVVFRNDRSDDALAAAQSIVAQSIYSALCAPLIAGESVLGVLYVDFQLAHGSITGDDAQLAAQIARVAAIKLESTRLREAALEKGRLDEALRLAQAIQMRMLPQVPPQQPGSPFDIAAAIRPARQVGGDFYDFHQTPEGRLYLSIGDVSGKGIPAALTMAVTRALMRSFILSGQEPAAVMTAVNRQLCDETDDSMFVTAFCAVIDPATGQLRYANAGHNPPLIVGKDGAIRQVPTRPGIVLGHLPQFKYVEEATTLVPGDLLFLYTDGITEATNAAEEFFSEERLNEVLRQNTAGEARGAAAATLAAVAAFAGNAPQSDDLTLLCVRYAGRVPQGG